MGKDRSLPFVRLSHTLNRTPTGKRTATPAKRAARYFAFANDRKAEREAKQRGAWYGPGGTTHDHQAVLAWAAAQAKTHAYTFQALLSVPEGRLGAEDFARAMKEGQEIDDWRLLAHNDTAYSHAHVLFFRDSRLERERFAGWHRRIRRELAALEEAALQAGQRSAVDGLAAEEGHGRPAQEADGAGLDSRAVESTMDGGWELG